MFALLTRMLLTRFTAFLLIVMIACSGKANDATEASPDTRGKTGKQTDVRGVKAGRILFLGNSITRHGPAPKIGWTGNWGMAASEEAKDYVHVLVHALAGRWGESPEFQVHNVAVFERQYDTYDVATILQSHREFQSDIVIVALGENVPALESEDARTRFKGSLRRLLTGLKESGQPVIIVRSCFWPNKAKDEILRQACEAVGGMFVDISELGKDESNFARSEGDFAHAGVAAHPGDKGMKAIADAVLKVLADR